VSKIVIRNVCSADCEAIINLEKKVWEKIGAPVVTEELFHKWVSTNPEGFLVAVFEGHIHGYAYLEYIEFTPDSFNNMQLRKFLQSGYEGTGHCPSGNTMNGLSLAVDMPNRGIGKLILQRIIQLGIEKKQDYLIALARLPGLSKFLETVKEEIKATTPIQKLALYYAISCVNLIRGNMSSRLLDITIPTHIKVTEKDPVLCRFAEIMKMSLHDVFPSAFNDPESCNMTALMVYNFKDSRGG